MTGTQGENKTIYIGTVPEEEWRIASEAATWLGFGLETIGPTSSFRLPDGKFISIEMGSNGLLLSYNTDKNPSTFWDKFDEIKRGRSRSKET